MQRLGGFGAQVAGCFVANAGHSGLTHSITVRCRFGQAQANTLSLTADKTVAVASTTDAITMAAPQHVLLTAGGSALRITSGNITLTTRGPSSFKAAMKDLTGV